ncbi:MAG: lytic transglycosylase domain-containing protein [Escherichia coli]|nr:lytic transglycosylase domain-containing protein [Escherichia coli]
MANPFAQFADPATTKQPAARTAPPSGGVSRFGDLMEGAGEQFGIPSGMMSRVMGKESSGDPQAESPKGAYGLGQVLPTTWRDMGYTDDQMQDPAVQAEASARYLRQMYDRYGDWGLALQAYHDGPGNTDAMLRGEYTPGPEGRQYVDERFNEWTGGQSPIPNGDEPVQHATAARRPVADSNNPFAQFSDGGSAAPAAPQQAQAAQPMQQPPEAATAPQQAAQPAETAQDDPAARWASVMPGTFSAPAAAQQPQPAQPAQTAPQTAAPATAPQAQPKAGFYDSVSGGGIADVANDTLNTVGNAAAKAGRAVINAGVDIARPIWNWAADSAEAQANSALPAGANMPRTVLPRISKDQDKAISGLEKMIGAQPGSLHTQGIGEEVASEILPYFVGPGELKVLQKVPGAARFVVNSLVRNAVGSTAQAAKSDDELAAFLKNEALGLAGDTAFKALGKVMKPVWEGSKRMLGFGDNLANETERTTGKLAEEATGSSATPTEIPQRPTPADPTPAPVQTNTATERLAQKVKVDQRVIRAAEELGMADKLTPAHYDLNPATKEVASRLQAVPESLMGQKNREAVATLAEHADDLIHIAGGTRDKVQLSQRFKDESMKAINDLGAKADDQYSEVRKLIPEGTDISASNTLEHIRHLQDVRRIELSPAEKKALKRLTPEVDDAGNVTKRPSYDALDQMRKEVGQAINQKSGPFKDEEVGALKQLYRTLTEDQEAAAVAHGAADAWNVGKALVAQRKTLEDSLENVIGTGGAQQATAKYGAAIKKLGKGDVGDWDVLINNTPKHLRSEMVATALNDAMTTGANKGADLNVPTFLKWYDGAQKSGALGRVMAHLDQPSRARLRNIATVARGLNRGNQFNISNGSINAFINRFNSGDSPIGKLFGYGAQGALTAAGWVMGGPLGAAAAGGGSALVRKAMTASERAQNARVAAADAVLADPNFLDVVKAAAYRDANKAAAAERIRNGTATADDLKNEEVIRKIERKLAGSPAWQKLMATLPKTDREDVRKFGISQWLAGGVKSQTAEDGSDEKK